MGDLIIFPGRTNAGGGRPLRSYRLPRGEVSKFFDGKVWNVDWMSDSQDSACIIGSYASEAEADAHIRRWNREHPPSPEAAS